MLKILSTYVLGKLNIHGHNCYPFSMFGGEVGIFNEPTRYASAASYRHKMACPWKCRSYLPTSRAISWTNHEKRHFQMRSSVLFWNWQISRRVMIPGWYIWVFFSFPAIKNSFLGALPPTVGWSLFLAGYPTQHR